MPLPQSLQLAVEDALKYINSHPQHEYHPEKRKELVDLLMSSGAIGIKTRAELCIVVGKRVLPIFEAHLETNPDDFKRFQNPEEHKSMPFDMIELAEKIVRGKLASLEGEKALYDKFYFMIDPIYRVLPFYVASALHTCYKTLNEVVYACYPNGGQNVDPYIHGLQLYRNGDKLTGENLTDLRWSHYQNHDSYAQGLLTLAYDVASKQVFPEKSHSYWHWWLTEALPQAWDIAADEA